MMPEERTPPVTSTCPECKSPLSPGARFCENCGAKIEPPQAQVPVCRSCGTPLQPNARFCENCGDPVKKTLSPPAPSPVVPVAPVVTGEPVVMQEPLPEEEIFAGPEPAAEIDAGLWQDSEPEPEPEPEEPEPEEVEAEEFEAEEPEPEPEPEEEIEPEVEVPPAPAPRFTKPRKSRAEEFAEPEIPSRARTTPAPPARTGLKDRFTQKKTLLVVGAVIALIVIAALAFVVMPKLTGQKSPVTTVKTAAPTEVPTPAATTASPAPDLNATSPAVAPVTVVPTKTVSASVTPGPVQTLPSQYILYIEVDKNSVTGDVTVSVTGPSKNVVKDIEVKLTRADDGTTETDHIVPSSGTNEVTVTGTRNPERVQVTVLFYSGEQYKVIDRIADFARRG